MDRRLLVPQPDVAALLADNLVAHALQCPDQTVRGHASRQSYAASAGINSSFT